MAALTIMKKRHFLIFDSFLIGGARKDQLLDLLMRKKQENWNLDIVWVTPNNIPTIIP